MLQLLRKTLEMNKKIKILKKVKKDKIRINGNAITENAKTNIKNYQTQQQNGDDIEMSL